LAKVDTPEIPSRGEPLRQLPSADKVIEGQLHGVLQPGMDVKLDNARVGLVERIGRVKGIGTIVQRFLKVYQSGS